MKQLALLSVLLLVSCGVSYTGLEEITLSSGSEFVSIWVEVADDEEERMTGLMHRTAMPADQGMLFVFPEPQELSFWMKNTLIPLDIIYFDEEGQFVHATTMQPCSVDPCAAYSSNGVAKYALEVNAGFVERQGIDEEWELVTGN